MTGGRVAAWGSDGFGQVNGIPPYEITGPITAISAGFTSSLALAASGKVFAWGTFGHQEAFVPYGGIGDATAIAAGGEDNLALRRSGTLIAWGRNRFGQGEVPEGLSNVTSIAAGGGRCLALQRDGMVVEWGRTDPFHPVPAGLNSVVAIAAGVGTSLALRRDGQIVMWGPDVPTPPDESSGVVVSIPRTDAEKPDNDGASDAQVNDAVAISATPSEGRTLVVRGNGSVVVLGAGSTGTNRVPKLDGVVAVAGGQMGAIALTEDGNIRPWSLAGRHEPFGSA